MAYRHEIYASDSWITVNHNRLTERPSGLVAVNRLSSTELGFAESLPQTTSGLVIAKTLNGLHMPDVTETPPTESVECADLDEFVEQGTSRILEQVRKLGKVIYFDPKIEAIDNNKDLTSDETTALRMLHIAVHRGINASDEPREEVHTGFYL